jgi:hypothetical protein
MSTIAFDNVIVTKMIEDAIEFCARKTGLSGRQQVLEAMRSGDCSVCEYLRYGLAQEIAKYLGSVDDTIKAVYTYEPESAALSSVTSSVSSALTQEIRGFVCPEANALCYELDIKATDDVEVKERTGYGALISSLYVRPVEVWHK